MGAAAHVNSPVSVSYKRFYRVFRRQLKLNRGGGGREWILLVDTAVTSSPCIASGYASSTNAVAVITPPSLGQQQAPCWASLVAQDFPVLAHPGSDQCEPLLGGGPSVSDDNASSIASCTIKPANGL